MAATRRPYTCSHSNNFSLRLLSYYWSTFNFDDWMILKSSGDLTSFLLAEEERNDFLSRFLLWINGLLVCLFKTKKLCSLQLHKVIIIHLWIFKAGPSWYSVLKFQMTPFILISLWKPIASSVENDKVQKSSSLSYATMLSVLSATSNYTVHHCDYSWIDVGYKHFRIYRKR